MSLVDCYILLLTPPEEDDVIVGSSFDLAVRERQRDTGFAPVADYAGGYKHFESNTWMFASNFLGLQEMCRLLVANPPGYHYRMQLVHRSQGGYGFVILNWQDIELEAANGNA